MKKVFALILCAFMLVGVLASCSKDEEKTTFTVEVTVMNGTETMYGPDEVTLTGTASSVPTVYDAICQLLNDKNAAFKTDTLAGSSIITEIDGIAETDGNFWDVLVNDAEPSARYGLLELTEGSKITFVYSATATTTAAETTETETVAVETAADDYE